MTAILELEHVSAASGDIALSDVSFAAERGAITAIVGPNGAGKSMLLDCIAGLCQPPVGRIRMIRADGHLFLLERMQAHRIARDARVARTFQNAHPFVGMSVSENMVVGRSGNGIRNTLAGVIGFVARQEAPAFHWLKMFGLNHLAEAPAGTLAYGAQRRLDIARAAHARPELLCLDEPATGLDEREIGILETVLAELKRLGVSIILAEHDRDFALRVSDHVVVLDRGAVTAEGAPDAMRGHPAVIAAYLGAPEQMARTRGRV